MSIFKKWNSISLVKRIIGGLIVGIILGLIIPRAAAIGILGDVFVGTLKGVAPILVFFLVMSSLANGGKGKKSNMSTVILLYLIGTLASAVTAVIVSFMFPVTLTLTNTAAMGTPPGGIGEILKNMLMNIIQNPVTSIGTANYIGILAWAVVFGLALRNAGEATKTVFTSLSDCISTVVKWVISFAPFGIMGLVFTTVSTNGLAVFAEYGKLLAVMVGCLVFVVFVINPLIVFLTIKQNPYPLVFKCLKESFITAFFTRSSAANIPVNMAICKSLGCDEDNYSVSIPLGATINMAGAAVVISVMTLATANTLGIPVDLGTAILLSLVASFAACGTSGVAGGSILLIPLACSLFGISNDIAMQVVGVGFIIGVIQDSCETGVNSSTDVLLTIAAQVRQWKKEGKVIRKDIFKTASNVS